jgi:hypothetical protein
MLHPLHIDLVAEHLPEHFGDFLVNRSIAPGL